MGVLDNTEPWEVLRFFEEIAGIPHGSGNTRTISEYLVAFAESRGLPCYQDGLGNVIIKKAASAGYEDATGVILQSHMDMVCEKEPGCPVDMEKDGPVLLCDGETITADGTTLGGDDGIGVAYSLAVLDSASIPHPPIEAVFTVDEEIGMIGVTALDMSRLEGKILLNIDSEVEGEFLCGCAGGTTVIGTIPVQRTRSSGGECCRLVVGGLRGGHSGLEIDKERANAILLMGRVLQAMDAAGGLELISADCDGKDNAIPVYAVSVIRGDCGTFERIAEEYQTVFRNEYAQTDTDLYVRIETGETPAHADSVLTEEAKQRLITALRILPSGVQRMSHDCDGLVETSLNLGVMKTDEDHVTLDFMVRSAVSSQKAELSDRVCLLFQLLGGAAEITGDYPVWEYNRDSRIAAKMASMYESKLGRKARIVTVHAGVECGYFLEGIPSLDAVSFGPDIHHIHTVNETLDIASVARTWELIRAVLADR